MCPADTIHVLFEHDIPLYVSSTCLVFYVRNELFAHAPSECKVFKTVLLVHRFQTTQMLAIAKFPDFLNAFGKRLRDELKMATKMHQLRKVYILKLEFLLFGNIASAYNSFGLAELINVLIHPKHTFHACTVFFRCMSL